jgi:hypothetical protein
MCEVVRSLVDLILIIIVLFVALLTPIYASVVILVY